jgi:Ser/Thr protein kinase RdoA (MazF antagonist)
VDAQEIPFQNLSPDLILAAVEAAGMRPDGRILALNSYENRVYQIGREDAEPIVGKFYRPGRWTDAAILEEHQFSFELNAAEIPVIAPLRIDECSLLEHQGFRYALFPRRGGRWPELARADEREWLGRFLGRIHAVGRAARFSARPRLSVETFGWQARATVLDSAFLPDYLYDKYADITEELVAACDRALGDFQAVQCLRIHGDCHRGNVLWTDAGPHFVDLDDCMTGPAVQDLWMLLSGGEAEMRAQVADFLEGYDKFATFDRSELFLIENLRALRMIHYSAWLARRWPDPAFPIAFPWFDQPSYWERHYRELCEQAELMGVNRLC